MSTDSGFHGYGQSGRWDVPRARGLGFSQFLRTSILMAGLVALLVFVGRLVGGWTHLGAADGMVLFGVLGVLFNLGAWWFSDRLALAVHRAQPADPSQFSFLYEIVEELAGRAGLPMPRVYIIPSMTPNAFATGRNPSHAAVAVTQGILRILDKRQLRGVLAHEMSHVRNHDTLISTIAASIAGLISAVGIGVRWSAIFGGWGGRDRDDNIIGLLVMGIVAPLVAMLVQLAISRSREYGADETGAKLCGDPDALADALERLEVGVQRIPYEHAGMATAHLFIVNPFSGRKVMRLLSTHPPTEERIARLRKMSMTVR